MKFLYAFAALKNIPERPDFLIYHNWHLKCTHPNSERKNSAQNHGIANKVNPVVNTNGSKLTKEITETKESNCNLKDEKKPDHPSSEHTDSKVQKLEKDEQEESMKNVIEVVQKSEEPNNAKDTSKVTQEQVANKETIGVPETKNESTVKQESVKNSEPLNEEIEEMSNIEYANKVSLSVRPERVSTNSEKTTNAMRVFSFDRSLAAAHPFACTDNTAPKVPKEIVFSITCKDTEEAFKAFLEANSPNSTKNTPSTITKAGDMKKLVKTSANVNNKGYAQKMPSTAKLKSTKVTRVRKEQKAKSTPKTKEDNFDYEW